MFYRNKQEIIIKSTSTLLHEILTREFFPCNYLQKVVVNACMHQHRSKGMYQPRADGRECMPANKTSFPYFVRHVAKKVKEKGSVRVSLQCSSVSTTSIFLSVWLRHLLLPGK
jgi:hypothetical protein